VKFKRRSRGKFIKFRADFARLFIASPLFELCAPDFPPKSGINTKNHGLKAKFKSLELVPRI